MEIICQKGLNKGQWKSSLYASNFVAVGSNKIKLNYLSALDRLAYQGKKKKKAQSSIESKRWKTAAMDLRLEEEK